MEGIIEKIKTNRGYYIGQTYPYMPKRSLKIL
jgi:hypothetical protein